MSKVVPQREPAASLRNHYALRAGVGALWVAAAFTVGLREPAVAGALLVLYPAWDALANALDARANGGFGANRSQALNTVVSGLVAVAVAVALTISQGLVLGLFGAWAIGAGLLQLATAVRRWKVYGAQWAMALSGAQSAVAGGVFIFMSVGPMARPAIAVVAGYAAFGVFYFLVSAILLTVRQGPETR